MKPARLAIALAATAVAVAAHAQEWPQRPIRIVVPFAAATKQDAATRWALALFAAMIAVLYIRSTVFYVHPLLLLAGIHVYEASRNGVPVILLTRQRYLRQRCDLTVVSIGLNVYLETPE